MDVNLTQFGRFLQRKANDKIAKATGVNILGKKHHTEATMHAMGLSNNGGHTTSQPDKIIHLGGGGSGGVPGGNKRPHAEPELSEEYPRALIRSVEDFLSERDSLALTPHGGAVLFLHALLNYAQPSSRHVGQQMLVLSMWEECLVAGSTYKGYSLAPQQEQRLAAVAAPNDCVVRSYVAGAVPEHGYWFDPDQVGTRFLPLPAEIPPTATEAQLLLWSNGADAPRPITLRKNKKGFWKVVQFEALLAAVRPPTAPVHTAADDL